MFQIQQQGYYPLTKESIDLYAPANPGVYMLAVRQDKRIRQPFFATQSDNLYLSLHSILNNDRSQLPPAVREYVGAFECYFTYLVIPRREYRNEVQKMLLQTSDPILMLKVVNCN
jgi:hypothetical protein